MGPCMIQLWSGWQRETRRSGGRPSATSRQETSDLACDASRGREGRVGEAAARRAGSGRDVGERPVHPEVDIDNVPCFC